MKTKTLLSIRIPADDSCHDFRVPKTMTVAQATAYMATILSKRYPRLFAPSAQPTLIHKRSGRVQNPNDTVATLGYVDGEEFFLL